MLLETSILIAEESIFCLLFILATALAHYSECAQAGHHLDLAAEHEASLIDCPDAFPSSNIQAASTIQPHGRNFSNALPCIRQKMDSVVSDAWFKDHPFWKLFSQQGLFRLEEVYRL